MNAPIHIDLRERGALSAQAYISHRLRDLHRGKIAELFAEDEPTLTLEAVSLSLRHRIYWEVTEQGPPLWRARLLPRKDVEATTLMDVLQRDHARVDGLFADALQAVNAGNVTTAALRLHDFSVALRRHIQVENDLLAPAFLAPRDPGGGDPTSVMLREHDEILEQIAFLEAYFADELPQAAEVAPFFAVLAGQLAKHEGREEDNLFPQWARALRQAGPGAEAELVARVKEKLSTR